MQLVRGERERPVGVAQLDQADDGVQPVRRLVGLRPERLGQTASRVELTGQGLQVGPVAEGGDVPEPPLSPQGRSLVEDEDPGRRDVELVLARLVVTERSGERGREAER
ncbi:hypothetical protein [Intrasporangium calvum]|uniref:hypothetical protein n=1 Tax=Intrasporangium calvum TaxID=53358 RepID=UPI001F268E21|nr:hypothetical protein [Intrasporangium calvum]